MKIELEPGQSSVKVPPAVVDLDLPLKKSGALAAEKPWRIWWERLSPGKLLLFSASLYLFILAISLMKDGARGIAPWVRDGLSITNAANSLGFGWLFAYLIMSGSPVAAAALTFFDAGVIDKLGAFTMITGSRLGASFIVLFIGFLYILRGRDRATSLSMGLLSLLVTATTYIPGLFVGAAILHYGWLDAWQPRSGALLHSVIDTMVDPITRVAVNLLPNWLIFILGLGIILISFNFFDKCLPRMSIKESQFGWMSHLIYKPWVMFILGAFVTTISMSVSISLSILVPLSARGFVRRENVIPYIMGANITTFIDTLLAAVLLSNPASFTVVFVEMASISVISILILGFLYQKYQHFVLDSVAWITASNRNLALFMALIFCIPIILVIV
jgi:solute carrier family 34 (sodium-dependent phosphate cotransporter)